MIRRVLPIAAAFALGAMALTASIAAAQPANPPARFAGTVTINGAVAPSGTAIEARIGSTVCGTTTTFLQNSASNYVVDVPAAAADSVGCGTDGATVTLYVNGSAAGSGPWRNFELNNVNLVVGAGTPTTTATASPSGTAVTTPRPPTTGSGLVSNDSGLNPLWLAGLGALVITGAAGVAAATRRASR